LLMSWTLGGYPSANLQLLNKLGAFPRQTKEQALDSLAKEKFGEGAEDARQAWKKFSEAFTQYPFNGGVIYNAPVQLGPANLLYAKKTGYAATMVGLPYDDVNGWRGPYPAEVLAGQYETMSIGFIEGVGELEKAVAKAPPERAEPARKELGVAQAAAMHFLSVAKQVRFVLARDSGDADRAARMKRILKDERILAVEL